MSSEEEVNEIFEKITEHYQDPVPIGGRCESTVFYRVEDLTDEDLNTCAEYVARRIKNVVAPLAPQLFLKLPGGYSFFAERLCAVYNEKYAPIERLAAIDARAQAAESEKSASGKGLVRRAEIPLEQFSESKLSNGFGDKFRGSYAVMLTDVITTARSSLEAHTKATLRGVPVLCWATLIDRTFGPGPVPVVSALTGAPVRLLSRLG